MSTLVLPPSNQLCAINQPPLVGRDDLVTYGIVGNNDAAFLSDTMSIFLPQQEMEAIAPYSEDIVDVRPTGYANGKVPGGVQLQFFVGREGYSIIEDRPQLIVDWPDLVYNGPSAASAETRGFGCKYRDWLGYLALTNGSNNGPADVQVLYGNQTLTQYNARVLYLSDLLMDEYNMIATKVREIQAGKNMPRGPGNGTDSGQFIAGYTTIIDIFWPFGGAGKFRRSKPLIAASLPQAILLQFTTPSLADVIEADVAGFKEDFAGLSPWVDRWSDWNTVTAGGTSTIMWNPISMFTSYPDFSGPSQQPAYTLRMKGVTLPLAERASYVRMIYETGGLKYCFTDNEIQINNPQPPLVSSNASLPLTLNVNILNLKNPSDCTFSQVRWQRDGVTPQPFGSASNVPNGTTAATFFGTTATTVANYVPQRFASIPLVAYHPEDNNKRTTIEYTFQYQIKNLLYHGFNYDVTQQPQIAVIPWSYYAKERDQAYGHKTFANYANPVLVISLLTYPFTVDNDPGNYYAATGSGRDDTLYNLINVRINNLGITNLNSGNWFTTNFKQSVDIYSWARNFIVHDKGDIYAAYKTS